ncbi:RNA polymerase recycling motor HelD [Haloimpatiens sp. FM7330]|uniref:RNA polymerase recycling motor HelD n=1 Tax=Haloimpatiens sp. FM7330 TaxID=3298610 RepID=UPI003625AA03
MPNEILNYEKEKLKITTDWIGKELKSREKNKIQLEKKVADLKKTSGGTYSIDLELNKNLLEVESKNLNKFNESYQSPYFGRIDFKERIHEKESFYIGKFGLEDRKNGEEVVIDWRAPIADLYYSGTQGEVSYTAPIGEVEGELLLKRRFLIKQGLLEDAFDEGINEIILKNNKDSENALVDEFLKINLEESISGKLKDVVATIQKEQNDIIRLDKDNTVIIQGSAGSGKTTVALHRLAYLIYRYKDKMSGEDILVVAPNKIFLDYISEILPDLGVDKVKQSTFEEIACEILGIKNSINDKDYKLSLVLENKDSNEIKYIVNSSKVKGSLGYKIIMDLYIRYLEKNDNYINDIEVENYNLFSKEEIKRLYIKDLKHLPMNTRKKEIGRYFKGRLKDALYKLENKIDDEYSKIINNIKSSYNDEKEKRKKIIETYDKRDEIKEKINKNAKKNINAYIKGWICKSVEQLYMDLFNDEKIFNTVTGEKIPNSLYEYMQKEINSNYKNKLLDSDDLAAMLYLKFKIDGVDQKYKQIVIDEAQDYSLFQYYVLKQMSANNGFTIVGDLGQGIYYYRGIDKWNKIISKVFEEKAQYIPLTQSYRSTIEIINFANRVLEKQQNKLVPAVPILRHGDSPQIIEANESINFCENIDKIVRYVKLNGKNSVAIICKTYEECEKAKEALKNSDYDWNLINTTDKKINLQNIIIPSYMTKGLEFDCSVIYNCNDKNYTTCEVDKKILYVVLTRALHYEYIFYKGNISTLIE